MLKDAESGFEKWQLDLLTRGPISYFVFFTVLKIFNMYIIFNTWNRHYIFMIKIQDVKRYKSLLYWYQWL